MKPGPFAAASLLAMRGILKSPMVRIVARRLGVTMPTARVLTALLFFAIAALQRLRRVRNYLAGLARRRP